MREPEKQELLWLLRRGFDALHESLAEVDDESARRRPGPDRWSILDCVEHVAVVEEMLFGQLMKSRSSNQSHENRLRETKIRNFGVDRTRRIDCPDYALPRGIFRDLPEALEHFELFRGETVRFVENFKGDPKAKLTTHPLVFTPVNCYEMVLMVALHPARHAEQIMEVKEALVRQLRMAAS